MFGNWLNFDIVIDIHSLLGFFVLLPITLRDCESRPAIPKKNCKYNSTQINRSERNELPFNILVQINVHLPRNKTKRCYLIHPRSLATRKSNIIRTFSSRLAISSTFSKATLCEQLDLINCLKASCSARIVSAE
jgi:hypothetical protein